MHLALGDDTRAGAIWVYHQALEPVPFMGTLIDRSRPNPEDQPPDVFIHVNEWLQTQPANIQLGIFDVLSRIRLTIEYVYNVEDCTRAVRALVKELYDIVNFDSIRTFVGLSPLIHIPSSIVDSYDRTHQLSGTEGQTYNRAQYVDLISLSVALRLVYPVFVAFISAHAKTLGLEFKEFQALSLLHDSRINDHPAMEKLRLYVETCLSRGNARFDAAISITGCGTSNFATMGLAAIVVKKLSCCDIRGVNPRSTPVSTMWQIIKSLLEQRNAPPSQRIITKGGIEGTGNDDADSSSLEAVKIVTDLSVMEEAAIHVQCEKWEYIALELDPKIDLNEIRRVMQAIQGPLSSQGVVIQRSQEALLGWVLAPVFSTHALAHVDSKEIITLLSIATVRLWSLGYKHLAALLCATKIQSDSTQFGSTFGSRARITDDRVAEIERLYTHVKMRDRPELKGKKPHIILLAINTVAGMFASEQWAYTLPTDMVSQLTGAAHTKVFTATTDIANQLAQYVIDFNR